jgi:hypothetical protein
MVGGRVVVQCGQLITLELPGVIERHNRISRAMIEG